MSFIYDDYADKDLIGHENTKNALVKLIKENSEVAGEKSGSFTIGIYGEWGTGKTSMLRMVQKELDLDTNTKIKSEDDQDINKVSEETIKIKTIWFNPWQFTKDDNIIASFFYVLANQLSALVRADVKNKDTIKEIKKHLLSAARKINFKAAVDFPAYELFKIKLSAEKGEKKIEDQNADELVSSYINNDTSSYYGLLEYLREETKKLDFQIVVFIDDLDRCESSKAVDLLDGLKVLLDLSRFCFVIAMANERIEKAARKRFHEDDEESAIKYLDKIIQFSFFLPPPNKDSVKKQIIEKYLRDIDRNTNTENQHTEDLKTNDLSGVILDVLGSNPRTIKRFLNSIIFAKNLSEIRFGESKFSFSKLVNVTLLAFVLPKLHGLFCIYPKAYRDLKKWNEEVSNSDNGESNDYKSGSDEIDRLLKNNIVSAKLQRILQVTEYEFESDQDARNYLDLSGEVKSIVNTDVIHDSVSVKKFKQGDQGNDLISLVKVPFRTSDTEIADPQSYVYMSKTLITQSLYEEIMGENPSEFRGQQNPVDSVSWMDAIKFCNKLSEKLNLNPCYQEVGTDQFDFNEDADGFRLPTEQEWKSAARGYSDHQESYVDNLGEKAWFLSNSSVQSQSVGLKVPTSDGVYDIYGNLWEWVNDSEAQSNVHDQYSRDFINKKICKGGSWANFTNSFGVDKKSLNYSDKKENNIGFRVVSTKSI